MKASQVKTQGSLVMRASQVKTQGPHVVGSVTELLLQEATTREMPRQEIVASLPPFYYLGKLHLSNE